MFDEEPSINLPYDDAPADYVPASLGDEPEASSELNGSLADRLAPPSRVYPFANADTAVRSTIGKLKGVSQGDVPEETEDSMDVEPEYRVNSIRLQGDPISHLATDQIFAYVVKFATAPVGLEWVNDTTCVIIFSSPTLARAARRFLLKSEDTAPELLDPLEVMEAKHVPSDCWPAKAMEAENEGMKRDLEGAMTVRFAKMDDVKSKYAREKSMFYYKYGPKAGQEGYIERESRKRRREDGDEEEGVDRRQELDSELEAYLADTPDERAKRRRANLDNELDAYLADDPRNGDGEAEPRPRASLMSRISEDRRRDGRRGRRAPRDDGLDSHTNGTNGVHHSPRSRFRSDLIPSSQSRARELSPGRRDPDRRYRDRGDADGYRYEKLPSDEESWKERRPPRRGAGRRGGERRATGKRPVNADQLDAELDAYLNDTA